MKIIALFIFFHITHASANSDKTNNYLLKPSGIYGVGYQDVFLVNSEVCPDPFYHKNVNEQDFSPSNDQHCHEIALRVYYPSKKTLMLGDEYYAPSLIGENNWIVKKNNLSNQEVVQLNELLKIRTYNSVDVEPSNKQKFPVIVFMVGAGQSVQTYNNIISNLVSNGYIVLGVNSIFTNGALKLSNGHIVTPPDSYSDADGRRENISDLKFVLDRLKKIKYEFNLEKYMDFNNVGLIGHSRGAMSIVNLLKQNQNYNYIKSIILMDPGDLMLQANYPIPNFIAPSITIWSSSFKVGMKGSVLLGKNNYEVILNHKNSNDNFSAHNNFSDKSTMQYHPAYQIKSAYQAINVGKGNGHEIALAINDYVLNFFNRYLRPIH